MLTGRFGSVSGRPYVEAAVVLPRLRRQATLTFVVDTGADGSLVMPADVALLDIDYGQLRSPVSGRGIGGSISAHEERGRLVFADASQIYGYRVALGILRPDPEVPDVPSLLGRDVIHRWSMSYDFPGQRLAFDVASADVTLRRSGRFGRPLRRPE